MVMALAMRGTSAPGKPISAARARNLGIKESVSDLLIFLDSDCIPQPDWLSEHAEAHSAGHPVVGGGVLPKGNNYWQLVYNLTLFHEFLSTTNPGSRDYLPTLNISVERQVIQTVGGMDEKIDRVEDIDWTTRMRRAGFQPYFWPAASVDHLHNRTNLRRVWQDCALSGYHMRWLRLHHRDMLQAPGILRYRRLVLLLAPVIASWATLRIMFNQPNMLKKYWYTIPSIYLTKIGWCWGASRQTWSVS